MSRDLVNRASDGRVVSVDVPHGYGRLAQLVARFLHTEEVIGSSPVSPTTEPRRASAPRGFFVSQRPKLRPGRPRVSEPTTTVHTVSDLPPLPGPCGLCVGLRGTRHEGSLTCADCGWRYGDAPDPDLPLPVIEVVYYVRYDRRVKIGTSRRPRQRVASIRHDELLAFEQGGRALEQQRHREFASVREGGEWFTLTDEVSAHVAALRERGAPWTLYARWLSEALR